MLVVKARNATVHCLQVINGCDSWDELGEGTGQNASFVPAARAVVPARPQSVLPQQCDCLYLSQFSSLRHVANAWPQKTHLSNIN